MKLRPEPEDLIANPWNFCAFGFGSGLAPIAPGTFGSMVGVVFFLLLAGLPLELYALATLAVALVGIPICANAARYLHMHDHPAIVWDEIAGMLITLFAVPPQWHWIALGFAWFRLFDIVKPWPIRWLDRQVHGGLGIMLDDLLAGVFAALALQACMFLAG